MENSLSSKLNIKSTNVNLLKFVAAIFVIVCHAYPITGNGVDFLEVWTKGDCNLGGFAVGIFFFFSGLYVAKSFAKVDTIFNFIKKRIERIFPQLFVVVALSVLVLGPIFTDLPLTEYFTDKSTYLYFLNAILIPVHNLPGIFQGAAYQTVNGPLWTMPVEFMCYIMLAVIVFITGLITHNKTRKGESINEKPARLLLWLAIFVFMAVFLVLYFVLKNNFLVSVIRPVIIFTIGGLYYEYRERIVVKISKGIIAICLLAVSGFAGVFSIGMICLLPCIVVSFTLGLPQMKCDFGLFKLSYEMYLFGWPLQQVILQAFSGKMSPPLNVLITLPFDIILAAILFIIIEKWEKRRKDRKALSDSRQSDSSETIASEKSSIKTEEADKENTDNRLSVKKSVMWNTIGSFFYYFCQWLMTVVVVRVSGLENAGILTLCISTSNIWISISSFGMHNYQASDTSDKYSFKTYLASRYATGLAALLGCIIYVVAIRYAMETSICVVFYFLYRFSESLEDVYYAAFQKSWHIDIAGKSMLIRGIISIGLFTAVLFATDSLAITIISMFVACMLVVYVYDARKGHSFLKGDIDVKAVKLLIIECLPLAVYTLLSTFVPMAPRLIMENQLGAAKLGIYGAIAMPTVVVQMIATYVFNPFITLFAENLEKGAISEFKKTLLKCLGWLGAISVVACIGGLIVGKLGLYILYGERIAEFSALLVPLIICSALIAFMWLFGGVLVAARSFKWLIFGNGLSAVLIIPLSFVLERKYDMQGASFATIISIIPALIVLVTGLYMNIKNRYSAGK